MPNTELFPSMPIRYVCIYIFYRTMEKQQFSNFLNGMYANGFVMMSISIGHELGLFEYLCKADKPISVKDIADDLNLKER